MERAHHWFSRRYCSFANSQLAPDVKPQYNGLQIIRIDKVVKQAIYRVKLACKSVNEPGSFELFMYTQLVSFLLVGMIVVRFNTVASTSRLEKYRN